MRLCLVSREFAPFWGAGIGTYAAQSARAWAALGHETHVLSADHRGLILNGPRLCPGVKFHAAEPLASAAEKSACRFGFQRHAMEVLRTLEHLHERHRFDYIEFPDYWAEGYFAVRARDEQGKLPGAVLGVRLHSPTRLCRDLNLELDQTDESATLDFMESHAVRAADVLVSPTRSLLDWVRTHLSPPGDQPGHIVPYPFDMRTIAELGEGADSAPPGIATVLYYGRMERRKGVETLLDAARRLVDSGAPVRFIFIGGDTKSGPDGSSMTSHLKTKTAHLREDRLIFEPARPRERLGRAIRGATICCFPSLWENFPNACLEAMALGACVVASDAGGMGEIIEDGTSGVLFQAGNATTLVATLKRVLGDEALRQRISASAPARIAALCDPARVVAHTISAIKSATPRPPRPGAPSPTLDVPLIRAGGKSAGLMSRVVAKLRRAVGPR